MALCDGREGGVGEPEGGSRGRVYVYTQLGFPGGPDSKESAFNVGDTGLIPGLGRSPGDGSGTSVFLPREFYGRRSLASYNPWMKRVGNN